MPSGILPVPHRRLRPDRGDVFDLATSDGREIRLTRFQAGDKGPVVLAPGYGTSTPAWTIDTVETNFPEYLAEHGYDIWMLDYRASPMLPAASTDCTVDDIATHSWPPPPASQPNYADADVFVTSYRDRADAEAYLRVQAPHPPEAVASTKEICSCVYDTYGRFPAHTDAWNLPGIWAQFSYGELPYYERFATPDHVRRQRDTVEPWGRATG